MSWRFVAYEKFVFGSTLPAISIGHASRAHRACRQSSRRPSPWSAGRARDLETHHVELLAEAIQPRWPRVAGIALQVVLTGEGRNRLDGLHLQVAEHHRAKRDDDERASEHEPSPSRATSASSPSEIG